MSPRFPVVTSADLVRVVRKLGFVLDRQKGSHAVFRREADRARVVISIHANRAIPRKTLASILDDLGLTVEKLTELL